MTNKSSKLDLSPSIQVSLSTPFQVNNLYTLNKVEFMDLLVKNDAFEHLDSFTEEKPHMCSVFHCKTAQIYAIFLNKNYAGPSIKTKNKK